MPILRTQGFVSLPMSNSSCLWRLRLLDRKATCFFNEFGRREEWDPRLPLGNPATDPKLKQYLKAVTAQQLQAQATPKQANPFFVYDFIDRKMQ